MSKDKRLFDLEERLIDFAVRIIHTSELLPENKSGKSPAPNYGEAQSAESRPDFIHKIKICLKELSETRVWLLMIAKVDIIKQKSNLESLINENNELISIFVKSVNTARQKKTS